MTTFECGQDGREEDEEVRVREGVLEGIEDVVEGRTLSNGQFDDVLDF